MNLEDITEAPKFSDIMNYRNIRGKVIKVYDGDSSTLILPLFDTYYTFTCRLKNIDTPELRTSNPLEKEYGYKVRDILREKILNKIVRVECGELDKYGLLLVEIFDTNEDSEEYSVNEYLIGNNYAFRYDGGTKRQWGEYLESLVS